MDENKELDIAEKAIAEFSKEETARQKQQQEKKKKKDYRVIYFLILGLCVVIIAFQVPRIFALQKENAKPHRLGTTETDRQTDACIDNLWKIVQRLQLDQKELGDYACPLNHKPYILTLENDGYSVECPNAELHGFSHLRITTNKPIPELIP
ncbi:hypothetical protein [Desulfoluna sp.]|uniref:hypothetical protein n=1 Tax=Desulfoluna sp. TaxID=2045199 RepID=UPI0026259712|nr:hypothetical protein [Desulfoluna sp.]